MRTEVTMPQELNITKACEKVISIIVSFFISSKNYIFDFYNLYMERELVNIY